MNITLENWLRNKLQETEEMLCYDLGTDTLRCWIDEYNQLKKDNEISIQKENNQGARYDRDTYFKERYI